MFTNFEKAFFKQNEIDQKIPAEVMQSLNEKLPEGFVYTDLGEGAAGLLPNTGGDFQLSGFSVQLPADLPDDLKPSTFFELIEYMYRTQTKIKLISKNNIIKINNKEFDIDELLKLPFSDLEVRDSEFYMVPKPFQNPFKVILESDEVKREFLMKRQPYPHMHKSLFKSIDNSVLEISYLIDEINNQIKFNFTLDIDKTKDIKQLIEALKIYKACMNGHIKINKQPLPQATDSKTELTSIDENINFWVKVLKLQSLLGVNFIPTSEIKHNDVLLVEELYRSLYENKPFKEYIKLNDLTLNGVRGVNPKELIDQSLSFQFIRNSKKELFGCEIELFSLIGYFDFKVIGVNILDNDKYMLETEPTPTKKTFQTTIHFINEINAKRYQEEKDMDVFQNAEEIIL